MPPRTLHPSWPPAVIEGVADVLASTGWPGLTNGEINKLLAMLDIADLEAPNKRTRLWAALHNQQLRDRASNCVIRFITEAMALGRHLQDQPRFDALRDGLAAPLSLVGLRVNEQGKVARAAGTATTLNEVAELAGRLRAELRRRGVHTQVVRYCEEELLRQSLFHAVFEATKGVSDRLRQMTGLTADGADLVDQCFGSRSGIPLVQINAYSTDSQASEHRGFANLLKGTFGMFRNPPAHTPRATAGWALTEPDALDLFSLLSLIHRRLDNAQITPRP
ncbi:TIGR02391 family protein [Micromonospora sp. WMMD1155]|uniref:TIGR02391 family protein n=1 Tax=Micromonospora sp. WMMD1155 TaxID=3016094 RepID=UPI002499F322|nr:TIGR02391 family protein [Micromonospora sp. WMMD1155]WFE52994.1 TIGR02391 family protein [Micromonospora sp. WMMD1155]